MMTLRDPSERSSLSVNWQAPINWNHPLNRDLVERSRFGRITWRILKNGEIDIELTPTIH